MKKGLIKYVFIFLFLIVCWGIGQVRNEKNDSGDIDSDLNQNQNVKQITVTPTPIDDLEIKENIGQKENEKENNVTEIKSIEKYLEFDGNVITQDNPWNTTAGYITIEDKNYIFLTPNTSVYLNDINCNEDLLLSCEIYEAMKEHSDGAGLLIWVLDKEDNIIHEEEIIVSNVEEYTYHQVLLSKYENVEKIKILCNNGLEDSDNGDWVLIEIDEEDLITSITEKVEYVKAVHYFSDSWPIDFWNSELDDLENEMKQIKKDGFNTIVLVIPWKEFQRSTSPIQYNDYPFEKLAIIVEEAEKNDLYVIARIGYTWDFYNDEMENILIDRYYAIMYDEKIKMAWLDYAATIYDYLDGYSNFLGGFMCWEDFWNNVYIAKAVISDNNVEIASKMGYQDWLKKKYTLEKINSIYKSTFITYEDVFIPDEQDEAFSLFFEFYDDFLSMLLVETQQVFPNLSMEVRVDADLVYTSEGQEYYSHESTYECAQSDFTTIVYGIPMGFENKGERVSASKAVEMTSTILGNVNQVTNNKALFIDQFLFVDNTPAFSHNAQVKPEELDLYLNLVSDVLVNQSWGYGIWTYKDYRSNMLYNSEFDLGTVGWITTGIVEECEIDNSSAMLLKTDASIEQNVPFMRNHFTSEEIYVQFDILNDTKGTILIQCGDMEKSVVLNGVGTYTCSFSGTGYEIFKMSTNVDAIIDNIRFYTHVQEGELYSYNGLEDSCIIGIRKMNSTIDDLLEKKRVEKPYYSFIENFNEAKIEGKIESSDYLNGVNVGMYYEETTKENAIYITPDVSIEYELWIDNTKRTLSFSYEFFELAKSWGSDGAILEVMINDELVSTFEVMPQDNKKEYALDLNEYANKKISIEIACKQGVTGEGDWMLIYNPKCD